MGDKGLDQLAAGVFERRCAAEVRGIGFHQVGVEVVLPNQDTQPVSQFGLTVIRSVLMRWPYGFVLFPHRTRGTGRPAQLLDRTQADSVSLTQGAIDGPG